MLVDKSFDYSVSLQKPRRSRKQQFRPRQQTRRRSAPAPPDAQQQAGQGQGRRYHGDAAGRVAEVAAAASVAEGGDGREHLGQAGVIAVRVPDALTDGLPPCRHTHTHTH